MVHHHHSLTSLWKRPHILLSSLSPRSSPSRIFSSFKEQKILDTLICFRCLLMEHGVNTTDLNPRPLLWEVLGLPLHQMANGNASKLPQLMPDQVLKLKQLTMLTLAEANKVLPYDVMMHELDVVNVRELEDFLINECMYVGILRGKLDQQRRLFEVQFAAGRDLRPGQLGNMIHTLSDWLGTSDSLLITIQEKIKWADSMSELDKKHKKENVEMLEEVKNALSLKADMDFRGHGLFGEPGGMMDYDVDRRSKRRRHPMG